MRYKLTTKSFAIIIFIATFLGGSVYGADQAHNKSSKTFSHVKEFVGLSALVVGNVLWYRKCKLPLISDCKMVAKRKLKLTGAAIVTAIPVTWYCAKKYQGLIPQHEIYWEYNSR